MTTPVHLDIAITEIPRGNFSTLRKPETYPGKLVARANVWHRVAGNQSLLQSFLVVCEPTVTRREMENGFRAHYEYKNMQIWPNGGAYARGEVVITFEEDLYTEHVRSRAQENPDGDTPSPV